MRFLQLLPFIWMTLASIPAAGQDRNTPVDVPSPPAVVDTTTAKTPDTNAGRIGQRQTREDAARVAGIKPMARINNRIGNRVQSRLRNRVDQNYSPQANAASPFKTASSQD
ncbi:hypothetical protein [Sphingomonas sp. 3-13AW]|uniref:hypothetical protein n=1 Tax=Sphingomonas sp. 3-13AW TaxID=3050450 RepID=UPI003BB72418